MKSFFVRDWRTINHWIEIDGSFIAAANSFYAALAVLLLILDRIWQTKPEPAGILVNVKRILFYRLRGLLMLLGIIVVVVLNFTANLSIEWTAKYVGDWMASETFWRWVHFIASVLLNALMFTAVYQALPKEKVLWRDAIQGGLLTAVSWELGRYVLAMLVVSDKYNEFGVVGVVLALLVWLFYGMNVILFGSTFVHVTGKHKAEQ